MNNKALAEALRAVLPYAENEADYLREMLDVDDVRSVEEADEATHAITAARLALQDADAAAHHLNCHARYAVRFSHVCGPVYIPAHTVHVMAECEADAERAAVAAIKAAGFGPGRVLQVRRVVA